MRGGVQHYFGKRNLTLGFDLVLLRSREVVFGWRDDFSRCAVDGNARAVVRVLRFIAKGGIKMNSKTEVSIDKDKIILGLNRTSTLSVVVSGDKKLVDSVEGAVRKAVSDKIRDDKK